MNKFLRAMIAAILLTMTFGLYAGANSTETANTSKPFNNTTGVKHHITVSKAWIRPTAPGQTVSGAFMTLVNNSTTAYTLTSVGFSGASAVEIHETSMHEGRMRMRKLSHIEIPANGSVLLKPGSYHIMLIGLEKEMKAGTSETLTLKFSDASQIEVEALVGTLSE